MYSSHAIESNAIRLNFAHTNGGLVANGGNKVNGFEVAGADKKFYPAEATITGNQVVVSSSLVNQPVAVRYNWANNPAGKLTNKANLPASPFRTDDWPGVTINSR
jgi:sialate O-acetylesterase